MCICAILYVMVNVNVNGQGKEIRMKKQEKLTERLEIRVTPSDRKLLARWAKKEDTSIGYQIRAIIAIFKYDYLGIERGKKNG